MTSTHLPPARFLAPGSSTLAFEHGTLTVKVYAPRGTDPQTPHTRDEIYVVISGSGTFVHGNERVSFQPGDFLFAAAGGASVRGLHR